MCCTNLDCVPLSSDTTFQLEVRAMNIFEIREVIRAPIGSSIGDRQVTDEWKAEACQERKRYEQAVIAVLANRQLAQSEKEWAEVILEMLQRPHQAAVTARDSTTEGNTIRTRVPLFLASPTEDSLESLAIEFSGVGGSEWVRHIFFGASGDVSLATNGDMCYYELTVDTRNVELILASYQQQGI